MDPELILEPPDVDDQSKAPESGDGASSASMDRRRGRGRGKADAAMVLPSFIWDYFVKDASGKFVICTLCPAQTTRFAYSGGTSTMNRHLRKKHQKYAPGKCAADYEYPRGLHRRSLHSIASPAATSASSGSSAACRPASGLKSADVAAMHGSLSPRDPVGKQRHQVLELRTARRRAANAGLASKRRKLLLEPGEHSGMGSVTEFDPAGFVTMPATATSHFPAGFELADAPLEMGVGLDPRFFDYASLPAPSASGGRGRRPPSSLLNVANPNAGYNSANHKLLTHRLLKYLIAQYEPLDVTQMGTELTTLLFGGATEWPVCGFNLGSGLNGLIPKLPSEETIKGALANLYYSQREILKEVMADVDVLSLSLNNWTSVFGQNVLTVSGHWISQGFRRRDCVLEVYVLPLDERVNTIALLRDVLEKWDIPAAKVAALTMRPHAFVPPHARRKRVEHAPGDADVETKAIQSEYPGLAVVQCFVDALEAAMARGVGQCADLTRRCRNYVSYFIQNPSEYQVFLALQRRVGEEVAASSATPWMAATADGASVSESGHSIGGDDGYSGKEGVHEDATSTASTPTTCGVTGNYGDALPVICDFDERWNATAQMLSRIVELEAMLLQYKLGLETDTTPARKPMQLRFVCCDLTSDEWRALKELARLLAPIEEVVHVASLEYPGLSIVYPLLHSLQKHVADAEAWVTDPLVATARHTIMESLTMDLCASGARPSSPYLSCLLDPRFKSLPFLPARERAELVEDLYALLHVHDKSDVELYMATEDEASEVKKPLKSAKLGNGCVAKRTATLLHDFFPLEEPATEVDRVKMQVQQYLDSPSVPATEESEHDPLEWWSRYQRLFPSLARLAKKYLCISAVSTPFQEAFTSYGQLMREKKARLDIEVAAQVLFCRSVSRIPEMERIGV